METTSMQKARTALLWFLSALPLLLQGQSISVEVGVAGGSGHGLKPAYFRNFYRSSGTISARFSLLITDDSGAEFDFGSAGFRINGGQYLSALGIPAGSGSTVQGGGIRVAFGTLSYIRFLVPAESGVGIFMLAGFGLDHVAPEPIRLTTPASGSGEPEVRDIYTITGGILPAFCAGAGLTIEVFENVSLFGEARIHYIFSRGGQDIVTGGKIADFTDYWTPSAGLKYGF